MLLSFNRALELISSCPSSVANEELQSAIAKALSGDYRMLKVTIQDGQWSNVIRAITTNYPAYSTAYA